MKKSLLVIVSAAMAALFCATALAQQEATAVSMPAAQSSPTPAPEASSPAAVQPPATQPSATPQQSAAESAAAQFPPTNDPTEIVRRSMDIDRRTLELARNYTCQQR